MRIYRIEIENFRGIQKATANLDQRAILIGPNNCGKSTIVEALALTLGRDRMVRSLTEHDFYNSNPIATSRIKIIVTLGEFHRNDPASNPNWFGHGRAVPKWKNKSSEALLPEKQEDGDIVCAQIGFSARFDSTSLEVETIRYFHDSDQSEDPFLEDSVVRLPNQLIHSIGFFLVPSSRTWDRTLSFGSELFTRVISTLGKVPSEEIIGARDIVRTKVSFNTSAGFKSVIDNINRELSQLLPTNPKLSFRLTSTDSDSLLRAMTPHFSFGGNSELPSMRHGSGLLSLQTLLLLLEFGKARLAKGENFILAIEEPELHLPPSMQKRVIFRANQASNQLICTSHSSRLSSLFQPTEIRVLDKSKTGLSIVPLLEKPLEHSARNHTRKLFNDFRMQLIEGLLHPVVLITEGRIEHDFIDLIVRFIESSRTAFTNPQSENSFSTFFGVIASEGTNISTTYEHIVTLKSNVSVLIDGDAAGNTFLQTLLDLSQPPSVIIQWGANREIEDIIGDVLRKDPEFILEFLNGEEHVKAVMGGTVASIDSLVATLKLNSNQNGLKTNYLAYEEICAAISESDNCTKHFLQFLENIKKIVLHKTIPDGFSRHTKSTANTLVAVEV